MEEKKVYIGNDTAGFYLKSKCIELSLIHI